jgi:bifunctional non-homologous end joining protein LigD
VDGKYVPTTDDEARQMLAKGDLKFRLAGKRLKGDFALVKMKGRRAGSKGNEWLLIKKHDAYEAADYDIDQYDSSVLSDRSMDEIAGDEASAEWRSRPAGRGKLKAAWLADAVAKLDQKKAAEKAASKTSAGKASSAKVKKPASAKPAKSTKPAPTPIASVDAEKKTKKPRLKSA